MRGVACSDEERACAPLSMNDAGEVGRTSCDLRGGGIRRATQARFKIQVLSFSKARIRNMSKQREQHIV